MTCVLSSVIWVFVLWLLATIYISIPTVYAISHVCHVDVVSVHVRHVPSMSILIRLDRLWILCSIYHLSISNVESLPDI